VLTLGGHEALRTTLAGRDTGWVEQAARQRLAGLLSWHPDHTLTAHPLVRDAFRPSALTGDTARLASDTALADLPSGWLTSRANAVRVVEMIELLLDADQWTTAHGLYRRSRDGAWMNLPAARLGQRAATAFIATPERQRACAAHLSPDDLGDYLNEAGRLGMSVGDLDAAEQHLQAAADHYRAAADHRNHAVALQNLSECYRLLGDADQAWHAAAESLHHAERTDYPKELWQSRAHLAAALDLAGDTRAADTEFATADLAQHDFPDDWHLHSTWGVWWGEFLLRTGRLAAARTLTERNQDLSRHAGWNANIARTERLLARCDLAVGDLTAAGQRLDAATATFRAGDYLTEWADTLPDLAEHHRRTGHPADAEQTCTQAITFAGPCGLVPTHARALAARARARADLHTATGDPDLLARARDDADHALRLATRIRRLPWAEFDALDALTHLDHLTGGDHGWRHRADTLRGTLTPWRLDPDPLTTNDKTRKRR